jgi:hypothetical protein
MLSTMPMPGALRLRAVHPLIEGDGSCGLVYDLERAAVVEVPEELQFHIAPALETGDLDEALLGWLVNEDLLTGESGAGVAEAAGPPEADWWSPAAIYRIDGELHARIAEVGEAEALEIVGLAFKQSFGTSRVKLHLNWGGSYPGNALLERIVVEASRLAGSQHQEISFELTLVAAEVTLARADFLAGSAFQVRLLCGSYPPSLHTGRVGRPAWKVDPVVRLLVDRLGDRLTVHCALDQGRLLNLWEWAKGMGVRHLDATVVGNPVPGDGLAGPGHVRELRNDLLALCEEMAAELEAQRLPIDYKPLTRIVDRLMRSEPLEAAYGELGGWAGMVPVADSYPRSLAESFDLRWLASLRGSGLEDAELATMEAGESGFPCQGCWARHACSHSAYVAPAQDGEEAREISEEDCALWRAEVEVALRFYHRLAHTDPLQVRRFFDSSREPVPAWGPREDLGYMRMPF